ncbi:MAG: NAD(P)-binding domain-containing protein [Rhodobacteraceae bacterium]|nr:NAD(P)-binding domain-containing protein [Paracoccaceae bacterium]
MSLTSNKIGLAGCGRMGLPMLRALRDAGFDATGLDVRPASDFGKDQTALEFDSRIFARPLNILFSVVRDIGQTEALLFDDQAIVLNAPQLTHIVICSTVSPKYILLLKLRLPGHITLIDAPMSGAAIAAQEKRLSFMLGGNDADLAAVLPMINAMAAHIHHMGALGTGMAAKVLNNLVAASSTATTRLALDWAAEFGLEQEKMLALMHVSSGQTWFGSGFESIEFSRDGFAANNTIAILKKDVESALDAAPNGADTALPRALINAIIALRQID